MAGTVEALCYALRWADDTDVKVYLGVLEKYFEAVVVAGAPSPRQALYGYRRASLAEGNLPIFTSSACPCLIIGLDGPLLHINAAYLTDFVYSTPMDLMTLERIPGITALDTLRLLRRLQVVRNTVQMLARSYAENHTGAYCGSGYLLPAPCVAPETGAAWTPWAGFWGFSLTSRHHSAIAAPTRAREPSRVPVYIKFVPKYGEDVHNLLFNTG
ncbi:hypothetical protein V8D89_004325 [Ganoderma adspersum]